MKNVAVIPARGGSRRIPRKNIREFFGKPVIAYSIRAALDSGVFDEVMVSTDDAEIASVSEQSGAVVPFLRSAAASDDDATISDVLREVLAQYEASGKTFDQICVVYPAAPLIRAARIRQGLELMRGSQFDAVWYIVQFSYPVQRALTVADGRISFMHPENIQQRSQDLPPTYHDAGQMFWITRHAFLRTGSVFAARTGAIELPETEVQDIDTLEDWRMAELKYQLMTEREPDVS